MVKKKYDKDDPNTWTEADMNKYILDQVQEFAVNLPWDKIVLSMVFTYGHWKAYGAGPIPTKGDVMLGIVYALTIPPALQGGIVANSYATVAISGLAIGLLSPPGFLEDGDNSLRMKRNIADATDGTNFMKNIEYITDEVRRWKKQLPDIRPPSFADIPP